MRTKMITTMVLISLWSASSLLTAKVAHAGPSLSQVDDLLKVGAKALGIGGTVYSEYNVYMKDGEVKRNFVDRNNRALFSYTANCRDRQNVDRFWQHPNNGTAVRIISRSFLNNPQSQRSAVLNLISRACAPS